MTVSPFVIRWRLQKRDHAGVRNRLDRMDRALPTDQPRPGVVAVRFQPLRRKNARPDCEEGAKGLTLDSVHHRLRAALGTNYHLPQTFFTHPSETHSLVLGGFLHVINDKDFDRAFTRFELQSELFL
jgi:hypothetical protein